MALSFAAQTRLAVRAVEVELSSPRLDLVARARASTNQETGERDRLLEEIVREYRIGPRDVWAAVLLDLLTPAILVRLARYRTEPPAVDAEDIRQQFVVELLMAAATMPMPPNADFVERRLVLRAGQGVRRWLRKEHRNVAWFESTDALDEKEEESK
jgi:hypothetical protein